MAKQKFTNHPINATLDKLETMFVGSHNSSPFLSSESTLSIFEDERSRARYMDTLLAHISEESERDMIRTEVENSFDISHLKRNKMFGSPNDRALEGFDFSTSGGSNAGMEPLSNLLPVCILGFHAKSKMLDFYKTMSGKEKQYKRKFTIDYVVPAGKTGRNKEDRLTLPAAHRNGQLIDLNEPRKLAPKSTSEFTWVTSDGFIKLGNSGNFLLESGLDPEKWNLDDVLYCTKIRYNQRPKSETAKIVEMDVHSISDVSIGDLKTTSTRSITVTVDLPIINEANENVETVKEFFHVIYNQDSSDYQIGQSMSGRITEAKFDGDVKNPFVLNPTIKAGRESFEFIQSTRPRGNMSIPLTEDGILEDFIGDNGETGTGAAIKYGTDILTNTFALINDNEMERDIKDNIEKCIAAPGRAADPNGPYKLAMKLGGYVKGLSYDLTKGGIGTAPLEFAEFGLKDKIRAFIVDCETETEFRDETPREWLIYGHENTVARFANIRNTAAANGGETVNKYGYVRKGFYSFSDNTGTRVKLIGTRDKRNKLWGDKVIGFMRSDDERQPTSLYYSYDFRVVRGREAAHAQIDSIMFWARDFRAILAMAGFTMTVNNPDNLIEQISDNQVRPVVVEATPTEA